MRTQRNPKRGFTLIELLVVVAVIGVLIGMLLPAVQMVRESARRTECLNNMRQLGLALHSYESAFQTFPPSRMTPDDNVIPSGLTNHAGGETAFQSWTTLLLPYVEQVNLADGFRYDRPWYDNVDSNNYQIIQTPLQVFNCPSAPAIDRADPYHVIGAAAGDYGSINEVKKKVYTNVMGVSDPGSRARAGFLAKFKKNRTSDCRDGLSNTFFVAECAGQPEVWIHGGRMTMDDFAAYTDDKVINFDGLVPEDGTGWADPDCGFSINGASPDGLNKYGPAMINAINVSEAFSFHPGGASFAMADGSVHYVAETIGVDVFVALCTRSGGETTALDY